MPTQTIVPGSPSTSAPVVPIPAVTLSGAAPAVARYVGVPDLAGTVCNFSAPHKVFTPSGGVTVTATGRKVPASGFGVRVILAHVYFATSRTIASLPEGHTLGATIEIHTTTLLVTADPSTGRKAERIEYGGKMYEVSAAGHRSVGPDGAFTWGIFFAREIDRP